MRFAILLFLLFILLSSSPGHAHQPGNAPVEVEVVDRYGRPYATFPQNRRASGSDTRAYLEAVPGEAYGIRVTNGSGERVGLVIAVDGRNIISGSRSDLAWNERMYVLDPWESATYRGWRTGSDRINEFFFTSELDSYAGAFNDHSAMGVVAIAVYRDRQVRPRHHSKTAPMARSAPGSAGAPAAAGDAREQSGEVQPGTGFGDERYAPTYQVRFNPQRHAVQRRFIKYEWRETLCEMGLAHCHDRENRFWPAYERRYGERGFASYPPGYRLRSGG